MIVRERPILFSSAMVRATREGRKTATRRKLKWPKGYVVDHDVVQRLARGNDAGLLSRCPYGTPGDRLWVRESHAQVFEADIPKGRPAGPIGTAGTPARPDWKSRYVYRADGEMPNVQWHRVGDSQPVRWTPSIHMPRGASRILLEIIAVRVERLQAGEGETAFESRYLAEGLYRIHHGDGEYYYSAFHSEPTAKDWCWPEDAFRELWESINGAGSWDANPWVWVVEFQVLEGRA